MVKYLNNMILKSSLKNNLALFMFSSIKEYNNNILWNFLIEKDKELTSTTGQISKDNSDLSLKNDKFNEWFSL